MEFQLISRSRLLTFFLLIVFLFALLSLVFVIVVHGFQLNTLLVYLIAGGVVLLITPFIMRFTSLGKVWLADDHFVIKNAFYQLHQYKLASAEQVDISVRDRALAHMGNNYIFALQYYLSTNLKKSFVFVVPEQDYLPAMQTFQLWQKKFEKIYLQDENKK